MKRIIAIALLTLLFLTTSKATDPDQGGQQEEVVKVQKVGADTLSATKYSTIVSLNSNKVYQFLAQFELSSIPQSSEVDYAELRWNVGQDSTFQNGDFFRISPVAESWNDGTNSTDATIHSLDSLLEVGPNDVSEEGKAAIDVTSIVKQWHSSAIENKGFIVSIVNNEAKKEFKVSGEAPKTSVVLIVYYGG